MLPIGKGEWRDETAKDFAAMANSGGGVILYGIAEERGRGTAKSIEPVALDEWGHAYFSKLHMGLCILP
ncbi:hypothetical protein [Arthrobacter sp. TMS2-4]